MTGKNVRKLIRFDKYRCALLLSCLCYIAGAQNIKHIAGINVGYSHYSAIKKKETGCWGSTPRSFLFLIKTKAASAIRGTGLLHV